MTNPNYYKFIQHKNLPIAKLSDDCNYSLMTHKIHQLEKEVAELKAENHLLKTMGESC